MSDAVILAAITGSVTVIVAIIGVVNLLLTRNINKKTNAVEQKVEKLATDVNGKITKLLETKDKETIAKETAAMLTGEKKGAEDNQAKTDAKEQDKK